MTYPRFQRSRNFKTTKYATAAITLANVANFTAVPSVGDLTVEAQSGDELEFYGGWAMHETTTPVVGDYIGFDIATIVSGAAVNWFGGTGASGSYGIPSFYRTQWVSNTVDITVSGNAWYTVQAADVVSGLVTVRLHYRPSGTTAWSMYAQSTLPVFLAVKNLGPPEPH